MFVANEWNIIPGKYGNYTIIVMRTIPQTTQEHHQHCCETSNLLLFTGKLGCYGYLYRYYRENQPVNKRVLHATGMHRCSHFRLRIQPLTDYCKFAIIFDRSSQFKFTKEKCVHAYFDSKVAYNVHVGKLN